MYIYETENNIPRLHIYQFHNSLNNFFLFIIWFTHWGRVTHICVSKLTIIGSDNGLAPGLRQAIISTKAGILLIWPLGTNFSEILIEIYTFSFREVHLKMSSGKWRLFCLGLNVLSYDIVGFSKCIFTNKPIPSHCPCKKSPRNPVHGGSI